MNVKKKSYEINLKMCNYTFIHLHRPVFKNGIIARRTTFQKQKLEVVIFCKPLSVSYVAVDVFLPTQL